MQWQQLDNESAPAYDAFLVYRDLPKGERSGAKVGQELGKSKTLIDRWSSAHSWMSRVAAWDEHLRSVADDAALEAVRAMNARHAANAIALQNKAIERLMTLDVDELTPEQLLRMIESGIAIERNARGFDGDGGLAGLAGLSVKTSGAAEIRICKLYAGIDMARFATAHLEQPPAPMALAK